MKESLLLSNPAPVLPALGRQVAVGALLLSMLAASAAETRPPQAAFPSAQAAPDISLRNEVRHAVAKGWTWLERCQDTNGFWSSADYPAITALALTAFRLQPREREEKIEPPAVKMGYAFLESCVQSDGGIYRRELPSYNTSISLVALVVSGRPQYQPAIINARKFIISLQTGVGVPGKVDNAMDGGIGYGKSDKKPDLSNTSWALEALVASKNYLKDKNVPDTGDLNWDAAIHFVQSCQNLPSHNPEAWASNDPQNNGGFIYAPGASKAGETNLPSGRVALRSYGSMSYAGLLSYIYADLKRDDPRVTAVVDWLQANYTLDENPALGPEGLYYYYHTMAKALTVYGADRLDTRTGPSVNWRERLALKLINLQRADGSWANENGRWFEKDPTLVTAYALIALDLVYGKL